jgi:hypothetical protein
VVSLPECYVSLCLLAWLCVCVCARVRVCLLTWGIFSRKEAYKLLRF